MARGRYGIAATFLTALKRPQVLKIGLLVYLWSLYPVIFTLSHNWFTITVEQIWFLLFLVPMVGIAAYGVFSVAFILIKWLWLRFGNLTSVGGDPIVAGAVCAIAATIYVFLHAPLLSVLGKDLLANKPRDDSYFGGRFGRKTLKFLTVESGVVLDRWVPLTERVKTHGTEALP